jgi:hypothetical protein
MSVVNKKTKRAVLTKGRIAFDMTSRWFSAVGSGRFGLAAEFLSFGVRPQ